MTHLIELFSASPGRSLSWRGSGVVENTSARTQPRDHMSISGPNDRPNITSGAR